ncbi:hypothetical protein [Pallidibacillus pasinlerensis]|uniref:Flagellar hook-length control protein-like C-terminal domain-containing protein n=1 Tax=Pallidibacillus pasinlerensis TaxID=2703818 RepID=A0ABX0A098_9BACI|nr:hypothetical protein [Pallidibacillus pasinlerensis]NCU16262.1 hypothetical protein [Pallidibacillus pasinlerensis]
MSIFSLTSLSQTTQSTKMTSTKLQFHKGQIISGKVLFIDSQNNALVQVQNQELLAKLEVPIDTARNYFFQVQGTEDKVILKVLENVTNIDSLLNVLQVPNNKKMNHFMQSMLNSQLPINKEIVQKATNWIQLTNDPQKVIQTMKQIHSANLPFSNEVFQSLFHFHHGSSLTNLLNQFQQQLKSHPDIELNQQLQLLMGNSTINDAIQTVNWKNGESVQKVLQSIMNAIGFNAEAQLATGKLPVELPLKLQLMNLLQANPQLPSSLKSIAEQLIFKITGSQLQTVNQDSFFQCTIAIPIPLPEEMIDAQFQFRGKKDKNGQLDKDFCQIVFDLAMPNIGKLITFMNVQNRIITLNIKSNYAGLEEISKDLISSLKNVLEKNDYVLSTVKFEKLTSDSMKKDMNKTLPTYNMIGNLDVKI